MSKSSGNKKKDALLVALRKGNAEKVGKMLDAERDSRDGGDLDPNMDADSARNSILHRAARYGHEDVVKVRNYIIRSWQQQCCYGSNNDSSSSNNYTPILRLIEQKL